MESDEVCQYAANVAFMVDSSFSVKLDYDKNWLLCNESPGGRYRSRQVKKLLFKNFSKFTEKQLCMSSFINKVARYRLATLLKLRL